MFYTFLFAAASHDVKTKPENIKLEVFKEVENKKKTKGKKGGHSKFLLVEVLIRVLVIIGILVIILLCHRGKNIQTEVNTGEE